MTPQFTTLIILGVAAVLLVSERLRSDLIALLVTITLGLTGVLTVQEAFSGFSRSAVITIMAIFVLAEGLRRTGVTDKVGKLLLSLSGARESWLSVIVMLTGSFLSLFMNNIAAASVLFPAVSGAARRAGISNSRLLMPMAFGTILGGMATLFTTSNIIVSSLLKDQGLSGYGVLDFLPLGLPIVAIGVFYMAVWGRKLLPHKSPSQRYQEFPHEQANLSEVYKLPERLFQASIPAGSLLIGTNLEESQLREAYHVNLVAVKRDSKLILSPLPEFRFQKDDTVIIEARPDEISAGTLRPALTLLPPEPSGEKGLESGDVGLVEVVLAPRSNLIGQTLRRVKFREKYQMNVLAIWRAGRPIRTHLSDLPLQFGDAMLLQGNRDRANILQSEPELIVLDGGGSEAPLVARKAWLAILIMVATLSIAALSSLPIGEVMLGGAIAMVLVGILTMDQVYKAIDWKSIVLIAGMLPFGIAMTKSGAAAMLGNSVIALVGQAGPLPLLASLVLLGILLSQVMNGASVATIIAPIAIDIARQMNLNPTSLAMGVAMASSMTFLTPLGHPVNILVMGPGGYRFRDYWVVGLPLTILVFAAIMLLLPLVWPLHH